MKFREFEIKAKALVTETNRQEGQLVRSILETKQGVGAVSKLCPTVAFSGESPRPGINEIR